MEKKKGVNTRKESMTALENAVFKVVDKYFEKHPKMKKKLELCK